MYYKWHTFYTLPLQSKEMPLEVCVQNKTKHLSEICYSTVLHVQFYKITGHEDRNGVKLGVEGGCQVDSAKAFHKTSYETAPMFAFRKGWEALGKREPWIKGIFPPRIF